jgi:predicted ATPase
MIESISIENFRGFEHLCLQGLRPFNLVVGRNASGKTAFLESVFLAGTGHPNIALRLRQQRFPGQVAAVVDRPGYEEVWRDLFFRFDQARTVSIQIKGSPESTRSTRIYYRDQEEVLTPIASGSEDTTAIVPIEFEHQDSSGETQRFPVEVGPEGPVIKGVPTAASMSYFPSGFKSDAQEAARRFSDLSKKRQDERVVATLKKVFPFIEDLSVQVSGMLYSLYAGVTGLDEKMPVSLVSEGLFRLLSYILAVPSHSKGVILIDEVENGLYYQTMPDAWRILMDFCTEYETQLFVSTHSKECLDAWAQVAEGREQDFCLLRTKKENGVCTVQAASGLSFRNAIEQDIEVR